jgi:hypothetical protein
LATKPIPQASRSNSGEYNPELLIITQTLYKVFSIRVLIASKSYENKEKIENSANDLHDGKSCGKLIHARFQGICLSVDWHPVLTCSLPVPFKSFKLLSTSRIILNFNKPVV